MKIFPLTLFLKVKEIPFNFFKGDNKKMADKNIVCADCGETFVFTEGQQEFFAQKGLNEPKRCKACVQARKNAKRN